MFNCAYLELVGGPFDGKMIINPVGYRIECPLLNKDGLFSCRYDRRDGHFIEQVKL